MEHCYIVAFLEVLEHEVAAAEPEFVIVAAGLELGSHLFESSKPQEPPVGLGAVGFEKTFEHPE